jgi:hypothetical protein
MPYKDPEEKRQKRREYMKKYHAENREKRTEYNKEWKRAARKKDPDKYREYDKKQNKKYYEENKERLKEKNREYVKNNKPRYLLGGAKKRAKDKSLPFDLELSDIVIPEFCPMLGIRLEVQEGRSSGCSPTLDRIVPEKGYTKGNVQVISMRANQIKSDATADEIMAVAKYMKEHENDV